MNLRISRQVILIATLGCTLQACGAPLQVWQGQRAAAGGGGNARGRGPSSPLPAKFVGNITTRGEVRSDFAQYWNQLTPENEGKWESVEAKRNEMDWTSLDAEYKYARDHGFPFKQHTFVWGRQVPKWLAGLPKKQQAAEVEEWIQLFCERYPDTPLIDVVNEPDHAPPDFIDAIGGTGGSGHDWVLWAFRTARKHCPNSRLILNDYDVLRFETDKFIEIADTVKRAHLLDAVGAQSHNMETQEIPELKANLAKLAKLGVPIYISEYDIDEEDDAKQKEILEQQFPIFWESPQVAGITLWGYIYGSTWKGSAGLIRDGVPRPALTWLMDYLHR